MRISCANTDSRRNEMDEALHFAVFRGLPNECDREVPPVTLVSTTRRLRHRKRRIDKAEHLKEGLSLQASTCGVDAWRSISHSFWTAKSSASGSEG
jgi:hypothetical protein